MKATLKHGVVIDGTPSEIAELLQKLGNTLLLENGDSSPARSAPVNGAVDWSEEQVRSFWNRLSADQKKLIRYVVDNGTATPDQLKQHLGRQNGNGVAGALAGITRHARAELVQKDASVVEWVRDEHNVWRYQLSPRILNLIPLTT